MPEDNTRCGAAFPPEEYKGLPAIFYGPMDPLVRDFVRATQFAIALCVSVVYGGTRALARSGITPQAPETIGLSNAKGYLLRQVELLLSLVFLSCLTPPICKSTTLGDILHLRNSTVPSLVGIPSLYAVPFLSTASFCFQSEAPSDVTATSDFPSRLAVNITQDVTCNTNQRSNGLRLNMTSTGVMDCGSAASVQFQLAGVQILGHPLPLAGPQYLTSMKVDIITPTHEDASFFGSLTFYQYACQKMSIRLNAPWSNILLVTALQNVGAAFGAYNEFDLLFTNSKYSLASFDRLEVQETIRSFLIQQCPVENNGNPLANIETGGGNIGRTQHNVITDLNGMKFQHPEISCTDSFIQDIQIKACKFPPVTIKYVTNNGILTTTRVSVPGSDLPATDQAPPLSITDPAFNASLNKISKGIAVYCSDIQQPTP